MGEVGSFAALQIIQTGSQTYADYQSIKARGRYEESIYNTNARLANLKAKDAIERGKTEANKLRSESRKFIGAQRAAAAAQGVQVDIGSVGDIVNETENLTALDAITIKNNAFREAFGYRVESIEQRYMGQNARRSADFEARSTILTGIQQGALIGGNAFLQERGRSTRNLRSKGQKQTERAFSSQIRRYGGIRRPNVATGLIRG